MNTTRAHWHVRQSVRATLLNAISAIIAFVLRPLGRPRIIYEMHVDPDAKSHLRRIVLNPDVVVVMAVTPVMKNRLSPTRRSNVIVVHQYRHGVSETTVELPGGSLEHEGDLTGSVIIAKAIEELEEETGYTCDTTQATILSSAGHQRGDRNRGRVHMVLLKGCIPTGNGHAREPSERHMRSELVPVPQFARAVFAGEYGPTCGAALFHALPHLGLPVESVVGQMVVHEHTS